MTKEYYQNSFLIFVIFMTIVAFCAIVYELLIADVLSYLLGDTILYFSVTIGLFLSSMGIGSYLSYKISDRTYELIGKLVIIELMLAIIGGLSAVIIYFVASSSIVYARTNLHSFLGSTIPLHIISFLIIILIGIFVGFEIPLLTRIVNKNKKLRYTIANILAADYVGSFLGAIAFPLLLLPFIGVIKTSFLNGILNASTVLLILYFYRIKYYKWYIFGTVLLLLSLIFAYFYSSEIENYFDKKMYTYDNNYKILANLQSPYQKIILTKRVSGNNEFITLFLNGFTQFDSESDSAKYHELLVHPAFEFAKKKENILILGGGDGLPAREVLRHSSVKRIVNVDIDKGIINFAMTNSYMRNHNRDSLYNKKVEIVIQDAFVYVKRTNEKFDIIILDFPEGNDVALTRSYSLQFINDLKRILNDKGIIVFHVDVFKSQIFFNVLKTLQASDLNFWAVPQLSYSNELTKDSELTVDSEDSIIFVSKDKLDIDSISHERILEYFTYKYIWALAFDNRIEEKDVTNKLIPYRVNTVYRPTYMYYYRKDFFFGYDVGL